MSPRANARRICLASTILGAVALAGGCASTPDAGGAGSAATQAVAFWPPFPVEPRIQFLKSYRFSSDIEPPPSGLDELIYGKQREVLPINSPYGVAMRNGRIYVCDGRNQGVIVLDIPGRQTRLLGTTGLARMSDPTDVAIAEDGMIYVSDRTRNAIFVFDANERHVNSFGFVGFQPTGLDVTDSEIFVADFGVNMIQVLDRRTGDVKRSFGGQGNEDGQFVRPLGVGVDPSGNVVVTDVIRCRIQTFSPEGELLSAFGTTGDGLGNFVRPKHVAVDADGIVYVVDASFANIQMFDEQNRLLMYFGASGSHPGSMTLPAGVAINEDSLKYFENLVHPAFDARRLVIVTNQWGANKVSVYAMGQLKPGRTVQDVATTAVPGDAGLTVEGQEPAIPAMPTPPGSSPPQEPPDSEDNSH